MIRAEDRLRELLKASDENDGPFGITPEGQVALGTIPRHYKRITVNEAERKRLAEIGIIELWSMFGARLYYTQAVIAGAVLSGDYDKIAVITCSQFGKSWLMGRLAIALAYSGMRVNVAASTGDRTEIIMGYCQSAASSSSHEVKSAMTGEALKKIDRLGTSLSKTMLNFAQGGYILGVTLGDTFEGVSRNKAVGRGGAYIVDEAALVSPASMAEIGRREYSSVDGKKEPLVMISNPHNPGAFYDFITKEEMSPREIVIWADALTACQESRWTPDFILGTDFAQNKDTIERYLLCELPSQGSGIFSEPDVVDRVSNGIRVMGVDAAWKGKDSIEVAIAQIEADKIYFPSVEAVKKKKWIDGVTPKLIIDRIAKTYHALNCELCCIDTGQGVWLMEGLRDRGVNVKGVDFGEGTTKERKKRNRYAAVYGLNKRVEMHLDLADVIENHGAEFSTQVYERIKEVLPLVTSETTTGSPPKIKLISKPEIRAKIGHSPDAFDAVLLALHAVILHSMNNVSYITE